MNFNTFATSIIDIKQAAQARDVTEILLEPELLARQGRLSEQETHVLAMAGKEHQLRIVLVWDALMPDHLFTQICNELTHWDLSVYNAVRVCDLGAAQWIQSTFPHLPLQLIVETGSHNLPALQGWCNFFAPTLERLVLSIELPEEKLVEYCQQLSVPCEVLGVGQILLFYSPRTLLAKHISPDAKDDDLLYIDGYVASERANFRPFPTVETRHGTLMFLDKDQFILDRLVALREAGLHTVRLDVRHLSQPGHAATDIVQICNDIFMDATALGKAWPRPTRAPFFKANKTTAQFDRMKSKLHAYRDKKSLAELIGSEKGKYVVFQALRPFAVTAAQQLLLPSDEAVDLSKTLLFRDLHGQPIAHVEAGQILTTGWIKKACAGALLRKG